MRDRSSSDWLPQRQLLFDPWHLIDFATLELETFVDAVTWRATANVLHEFQHVLVYHSANMPFQMEVFRSADITGLRYQTSSCLR